jgi:rhodanese-related sulfurtransferase
VNRTTINDLLAAARARLQRVRPADALDAVRRGAVLVDIRSEAQREADGVIPGALFHPRNVLEWRVDPASSASRGRPTSREASRPGALRAARRSPYRTTRTSNPACVSASSTRWA